MRYHDILIERLSSTFIPAKYGYWIKPDGIIVNIDKHEGHVDYLMDDDNFIHISPADSKSVFYSDALDKGWIRLVAKDDDNSQMNIQYHFLSIKTMSRLISIVHGLPDFMTYWFSTLQVPVHQKSQAIQIIRDDLGNIHKPVEFSSPH